MEERRGGRIRREGGIAGRSTHSRIEVEISYRRHIEETMLKQMVYIRQWFSKYVLMSPYMGWMAKG